MHNNGVLKGRFPYLTTRTDNKLAPQQARAADLLRWLHVVVTRRMRWNPTIAAGGAAAGANHAA